MKRVKTPTKPEKKPKKDRKRLDVMKWTAAFDCWALAAAATSILPYSAAKAHFRVCLQLACEPRFVFGWCGGEHCFIWLHHQAAPILRFGATSLVSFMTKHAERSGPNVLQGVHSCSTSLCPRSFACFLSFEATMILIWWLHAIRLLSSCSFRLGRLTMPSSPPASLLETTRVRSSSLGLRLSLFSASGGATVASSQRGQKRKSSFRRPHGRGQSHSGYKQHKKQHWESSKTSRW